MLGLSHGQFRSFQLAMFATLLPDAEADVSGSNLYSVHPDRFQRGSNLRSLSARLQPRLMENGVLVIPRSLASAVDLRCMD
ncbi:hypothetical protein BDV10DRAFT_172419 [Aspergillus recurvatus]